MSDTEEKVTSPETEEIAAEQQAEQQSPAEQPAKVEAQAEAKPEAKAEQPKPKERARSADRINALLAQRAELQREVSLLKEQLAKETKPKLEDFDHDVEQYTEAASKHIVKEMYTDTVAQKIEDINNAAMQEMVATFWDGAADARQRLPDFDKVVADPSNTFFDGPVLELVVSAEHPHDIAYYLANNKQDARRIASLPPHLQGAAIARLDIEVARRAAAAAASAAPPPPASRPTGAGVGTQDYSRMSMSEFRRLRAKERAEEKESRRF